MSFKTRDKAILRMTPEQRDEFLNEVRRLGVLATIRPDGFPQLTPLWYRWNGEAVIIWGGAELGWVQNINANPLVGFSVYEEHSPCPAVVMRGRASVENGQSPRLEEEIRRIARRYLGDADTVEAFATRWTERQAMITVVPDKVVTWAAAG